MNAKDECILDEIEWMGGHAALLARRNELKLNRNRMLPQEFVNEMRINEARIRVSRKYGQGRKVTRPRDEWKGPSKSQQRVIERLREAHADKGRPDDRFRVTHIEGTGIMHVASNPDPKKWTRADVYVQVGYRGGAQTTIRQTFGNDIEQKGRRAMWWALQYID